MFDENFENKLNANLNLIGFENGVYDLRRKLFRIVSPDNYISFSTKIYYISYKPNNKYMKEIKIFLKQIVPHDEVRDYLLKILSTCVSGNIKEEKCIFLTVVGLMENRY